MKLSSKGVLYLVLCLIIIQLDALALKVFCTVQCVQPDSCYCDVHAKFNKKYSADLNSDKAV